MLITFVLDGHKQYNMKLIAIGISVSFSYFAFSGEAEKQISKKEYVDMWRSTAVQQMIDYHIPASITLAQGILESGSGNSELAKTGNNHFGIKCHDWTGEKMYMDDDQKDECFRVYATAEESYVDHSLFLKDKKRYATLFSLEKTDYKAWAQGLKDAGYATNPKYSQLLIELIEDLKLNELDQLGIQNNELKPDLTADSKSTNTSVSADAVKHTVLMHENKVKYVIARKGDTYYRIAKEYELGLWQLYKYNDFGPKKDVLIEGDIVYIQPKRSKAKNKEIKLEKAMTLRDVSQKEAVKLESLIKLNYTTSSDELLPKGEKVTLH